jgi:hypothetical protein
MEKLDIDESLIKGTAYRQEKTFIAGTLGAFVHVLLTFEAEGYLQTLHSSQSS